MINRETGLPSNPLVETARRAIAGWVRTTSMKFLLLACSSIAVLTAGNSVQAEDDPISHGQSLVAEFCAKCHAIGIKGESPHPWAPPFRTLVKTHCRSQRIPARARTWNHVDPSRHARHQIQSGGSSSRACLSVGDPAVTRPPASLTCQITILEVLADVRFGHKRTCAAHVTVMKM